MKFAINDPVTFADDATWRGVIVQNVKANQHEASRRYQVHWTVPIDCHAWSRPEELKLLPE